MLFQFQPVQLFSAFCADPPGGNTGPIPEPSWTLAHSPETPGSSITEAEAAVCLLPHRAGLDTPTHPHWKIISPTGSDSLPVCRFHFVLCAWKTQRQQNLYASAFQSGTEPFNRAMLFNVGYKEAMKDLDWDCLIFHDVDHLMENDRNYYGCTDMPRHFAVKLDKYYYMWVVVPAILKNNMKYMCYLKIKLLFFVWFFFTCDLFV